MSDTNALDVSIDEHNLVEEWRGQPAMVLEYGILLADTEQEVGEAKARLAVVGAEVEMELRTTAPPDGLAKWTEASINATVLQEPEYEIAVKKLNDAHHRCRLCKAAVDALAHRKSALQGMTDLFMRQWYADPTTREDPTPTPAKKKTETVTRRRRRRRPRELKA